VKWILRQKSSVLCKTLLLLGLSSSAIASDFSLPFINASGLGDAYADWATATDDASVAYSNPAALVRLNHQQLVIAPIGILGNTKFTGSTVSPPPPFPLASNGSATSRIGAFMPSLYYASPKWHKLVFGFSETVPFALGTSYAKDAITRYLSTRTQIVVIDLSPSVSYEVTEKLSVGLGLDAARLAFTSNNMVRSPFPGPDFESQNHLSGWGFGWHGGVLYDVLPKTRIGASFNSMMMFHSYGDSESYTTFGTFRTTNQKAFAGLPARTQLSIHQDIDSRWAVMGTVFYTNWTTFQKLTLRNVILPGGGTTAITIPFEYHNTFDYSIGASFKATDKWLLRTGLQWMNTPSNNRDRGVADPIGSAIIWGLGAHYQQNATLGYDMSVGHSFFKQEPVNLVSPVATVSGHNNSQTTVIGAQINWNIT
jgi:long-chain fatty acid transport protein